MSMPIGEVPSRSEDATAVEVGRPSSWPGFASKPAIDAREYTSTRGLEVSLTKTSTSPAFQAGAPAPTGVAEGVATTTSGVRAVGSAAKIGAPYAPVRALKCSTHNTARSNAGHGVI